MKKHLHRLSKTWASNAQFYITTCTAGRKPILDTVGAHDILRAEWRSALERHGWAVGRYVIMPDHVHFFCTETVDGKTLSEFIGAWKQWTAKAMVQAHRINPPIWQAEFFDHLLRSDESFSEKWEYVHDNPVRKGLVKTADEWPYQGWIHYDGAL
ncbi:MAG: transposase [Kiritimatiellia bacterium]|nr:transposase [Kiritimatiellia bacterium]